MNLCSGVCLLILLTSLAHAAPVKKKHSPLSEIHPSIPSPISLTPTPFIQGYIIGIPWCAATSVIIDAAMHTNRELTTEEAMSLTASCFLPFVGGWLVKKAFQAHPEWNYVYLPRYRTPQEKVNDWMDYISRSGEVTIKYIRTTR